VAVDVSAVAAAAAALQSRVAQSEVANNKNSQYSTNTPAIDLILITDTTSYQLPAAST
jgi:hypothetical protein